MCSRLSIHYAIICVLLNFVFVVVVWFCWFTCPMPEIDCRDTWNEMSKTNVITKIWFNALLSVITVIWCNKYNNKCEIIMSVCWRIPPVTGWESGYPWYALSHCVYVCFACPLSIVMAQLQIVLFQIIGICRRHSETQELFTWTFRYHFSSPFEAQSNEDRKIGRGILFRFDYYIRAFSPPLPNSMRR